MSSSRRREQYDEEFSICKQICIFQICMLFPTLVVPISGKIRFIVHIIVGWELYMFIVYALGKSKFGESCKVGNEFVGCLEEVKIPQTLNIWAFPTANCFTD